MSLFYPFFNLRNLFYLIGRSTDKRSVCYRLEADEKKGVLQNSLFCSTLFVCN